MRRLVVCCLFVAGIAACERVCGDLEPLLKPQTTSAGAAGGEPVAGAGAGGTPSVTGGGGAGGDAGAAGSVASAGSESGGTAGAECQRPPTPLISDFEEEPPLPPLGGMDSDDGSPNEVYMTDSDGNRYYFEGGVIPEDQSDIGFTFQFKPCVDATIYSGIRFNARAAPANVEVSIVTASSQSAWVAVDIGNAFINMSPPVCVALPIDRTAITGLRFRYVPSTSSQGVELSVDNLAFYTGECPTN